MTSGCHVESTRPHWDVVESKGGVGALLLGATVALGGLHCVAGNREAAPACWLVSHDWHRCDAARTCPTGSACRAGWCVTGAETTARPGQLRLDFVVTELRVDSESESAPVIRAGFDLDCRGVGASEARCGEPATFSALDRDQNSPAGCSAGAGGCSGRVDNALPELFALADSWDRGSIRAKIAQSIERAELLFGLRVDRVDNITDDPDVDVTILALVDPDGVCAGNFGGDGRFEVDVRSVVDGDPTQPRWRTHGAIVGGRVRTDVPFAIPLVGAASPATDVVVVRTYAGEHGRIAFNIVDGGRGVTNGNWGGVVRVWQLAEGWTIGWEATVSAWVRLFVNLPGDGAPSDPCVTQAGSAWRNGRIGVGYAFTAVRASIGSIADPGAARACH